MDCVTIGKKVKSSRRWRKGRCSQVCLQTLEKFGEANRGVSGMIKLSRDRPRNVTLQIGIWSGSAVLEPSSSFFLKRVTTVAHEPLGTAAAKPELRVLAGASPLHPENANRRIASENRTEDRDSEIRRQGQQKSHRMTEG